MTKSSYFIIVVLHIVNIECKSLRITKISEDRWIDDYSCDGKRWSNCEGVPLINHGPYSSNLQHDTLSRSFECQHDSTLNISFYAEADCFFDVDDALRVSINDDSKHVIHIPNAWELVQNDSMCDDQWVQQAFNISHISMEHSTAFELVFNVTSELGSIRLSDIQIDCTPVYVPQRSNSVLFDLSWSSLAAIVYFSLYTFLLFGIAISVAIKKKYNGIYKFIKTIWKMRKIYGTVLVHLYDTATDIGVMIDWWFLAQDEQRGYNYESIDMSNLFWASVGFLALYRVIGILLVLMSEDSDNCRTYCFSVFLAVFDMYIIRTVWVAIADEDGDDEPHPRQRLVQLMESLCESLPQILLQSVFIVRGFNDDTLKRNSSVTLVALSLAASVLSITNKFIWIDQPVYEEEWHNAKSDDCPCGINYRWVLRVLYRFAMICVRFVGLSLIWVILGGVFLPIYAAITWFYWLLFTVIAENNGSACHDYCNFRYMKQNPMYWLLTTTIALVSNAQSDGCGIQLGRFIENSLLLSALTVFAFNDDINCDMCADPDTRQASENDYILIFLVAGWSAFVIETMIGVYIFAVDPFSTDAEGAFKEIVNAFNEEL